MSAKLSIEQSLMRAKLHIKKSEIEEAKKIYLSVLSAFPENTQAQEGLTALENPNQKIFPQNLPEEEAKKLINFYKQGYFFDVIKEQKIPFITMLFYFLSNNIHSKLFK